MTRIPRDRARDREYTVVFGQHVWTMEASRSDRLRVSEGKQCGKPTPSYGPRGTGCVKAQEDTTWANPSFQDAKAIFI